MSHVNPLVASQPRRSKQRLGHPAGEISIAVGVIAGGAIAISGELAALMEGHVAGWDLWGPRGGHIGSGTETSGGDFGSGTGKGLSFPEQSWYTHTEGKIISDLYAQGKLGPGRAVDIHGELPPCSQCRNIMQWASEKFQMTIRYVDKNEVIWVWKNGGFSKFL